MKRILPVIVISQFLCTSLWFAGNAIMPDLVRQFHLKTSYIAHLSTAVQLGFIAGTMVFALLSISDRFSPSRVFLICAVAAALINLGISLPGIGLPQLFLFRLLTGFFLAGIYPVGMKIASDHYEKGLGKSLGFLVGALVLGTAFPHLLKSLTTDLPWKYVLFATSALSITGGCAMYILVPDGPYRKAGQRLEPTEFLKSFRNRNFSAVAIGYFGHMWELYAFWVFLPVMLLNFKVRQPTVDLNISLLSFLIIAAGACSCVISGLISSRYGVKRTAAAALSLSGICCILSPVFLSGNSLILLLLFLTIWSMAVIADSPLFSTLVAQHAPTEARGTALTIVNCIGFSITIFSIQLISLLLNTGNANHVYMWLALGPFIGLTALYLRKPVNLKWS